MIQPTPLPEPFKWFANEYIGYTKDALLTYGKAEYERGLEDAAQICEKRYMGDNNREDMEARRCAEAIRAKGKP